MFLERKVNVHMQILMPIEKYSFENEDPGFCFVHIFFILKANANGFRRDKWNFNKQKHNMKLTTGKMDAGLSWIQEIE